VAAGFALAGCAVVLLPAFAAQWEVFNAGVGSLDDDVITASALVGAVHMGLAWRRLRNEERTAVRRVHLWIAEVNALVVLAWSASLLLLLVLYWFPDEHASLANRGFPVFVLWAGVQAVAVLFAEATARFFFWWLEPHERRGSRQHVRRRTQQRRPDVSGERTPPS
jgi:predicted Co/Zn/Cd cation transporter (cation efflux family)